MKKFLTVLLALSVVFTYSFSAVGSVFAAAAPASTVDAKVSAEQTTMQKAVEAFAGKIGYDKNKNLTSIPGVTAAVDSNLTEAAVNAGVEKFIAAYKELIKSAGAQAIKDGADETTANQAIEDAWHSAFGYVSEDETYTAATLAGKLFEADSDYVKAMYAKAITDAKAAFTAKLNAVDPALYSDTDAETIKNAIRTARDAMEQITSEDADGLTAVYDAESVYDNAVKGLVSTAETSAELTKYKNEKKDAVTALADAFKKDMTEGLDEVIDGNDASAVNGAILKKNTLEKDVANVLAVYLAKIDALEIDADDSNLDTLAKVKTGIDGVVTEATTVFTYTDTAATAFYNAVASVATTDILVDYANAKAATMKNEYEVSTGLAKYNAATVDKYAADIVTKIKAGTLDTYTEIDTEFDKVPTAVQESSKLVALKNEAQKAITENYTGTDFAAGNYAASNWDGERLSAVKAIQKEFVAKIKAAKTEDEVKQLVKDARKAMDAYLTTEKVADVKDSVLIQLKALNYVDTASTVGDETGGSLGGYADGIAAKNPGAFSDATKEAAVVAAADSLYEAVLAKNDANLKGSEISAILKANYDKALAVIDSMKTTEQLTSAEATINAAINDLPLVATLENKEQYLAVQTMIENYADMIGSDLTKIDKLATFKAYMTRIVELERKAVENQVKALPKVITIADKDAVEAAKAANDAYDEAYGDYNTGDFDYGYRAINNLNDLNSDIDDLNSAMMVDAAKKIAALPNIITTADIEAVEAARAAYDALDDNQKADFSKALLQKLVDAEASIANAKITSVESLKLSVSTKLYKGSKIRVNWKVKDGDASYITGYQVYKSTKAQKGYKFMGKTKKSYMDNKKNLKKGTRYYYKVRAYIDVDGERYYSDWSNKGNRIYKK